MKAISVTTRKTHARVQMGMASRLGVNVSAPGLAAHTKVASVLLYLVRTHCNL